MQIKKLMALLLSLCAILTVAVLPAYAELQLPGDRDSVEVDIYTPSGTRCQAYHIIGDATTEEIAENIALRARYEQKGAVMLADMSVHYNCLSFAIWNQDTRTNDLWLNDVQPFINDGSLIEIDEPVQGCIAFYVEERNTTNYYKLYMNGKVAHEFQEKKATESISHVAIVIGVDPGEDGILQDNEVELVSKWGVDAVYRHALTVCDYINIPAPKYSFAEVTLGGKPFSRIDSYHECFNVDVRYYIPNPALYADQSLQTGRTNRQGLYKDADGIRYYVADTAYRAGVVSDDAGHYYYIDDSLKAVTSNDSVLIPLNDTNGLIPDGVYSIDENGYITNLPTVLMGESIRNGVVKLADGQVKTMKYGYPTAGCGAYTDGSDYYYFESTPIQFGTRADGTIDLTAMTTDGTVDGTVSGDRGNGILPQYAWTVDGDCKITRLPTKLDSQSKNFGTGLMRLPDNTIVLYSKGVALENATSYTDPATGAKYTFTYGDTTYTVSAALPVAKAFNRVVKRAA